MCLRAIMGGPVGTARGTMWVDQVTIRQIEPKIYLAAGDKIQRANLDGSGVETLVIGLGYPHPIALDVSNGHMYWEEWAGGERRIRRAALDGSNVEDVLVGYHASDIELLLPWE